MFEVADSEFCGLLLDPDYGFQDNHENTEFTGKFRERFFFAFLLIRFLYRFSRSLFPNFTVFASFRLLFFRIAAKIPNFPVNSGRNFLFCIFVNSVLLKVLEGAYSEFNGFRAPRLLFFHISAKIPNLPKKSGRNFFWHFGQFKIM